MVRAKEDQAVPESAEQRLQGKPAPDIATSMSNTTGRS